MGHTSNRPKRTSKARRERPKKREIPKQKMYVLDVLGMMNPQEYMKKCIGYEVLIAPKNIREKLVCFTSISLWGLRIQETMGNISQIIRPRPNEYDKAYRTAITLKKLNEYLSINNFQNSTIKQEYIMRTIKICKSEMKDSVKKEINKDVMKKFNMLIKK